MAEDIAIIWNREFQEGDISYKGGELLREKGLKTAVLMSLYTDKRAAPDDELPDLYSTDRKGWWGDQTSDIPGDEIGSKLWLRSRSKTTPQTLVDVESDVRDALQWMIDDGVAIDIEVEVERVDL